MNEEEVYDKFPVQAVSPSFVRDFIERCVNNPCKACRLAGEKCERDRSVTWKCAGCAPYHGGTNVGICTWQAGKSCIIAPSFLVFADQM